MSTDNETPAKAVRRPLGRGLSALLEESRRDVPLAGRSELNVDGGSGEIGGAVQMIDVARVAPHPDQPRRTFDVDALSELAASIAVRGVIQPIIVRPAPSGSGFQIVAGERRWRAAQQAQLHRIPAIVRDFDEAETLEIALVENIQREDLNPIEEARAYKRLIAQFQHSQEALARIVGKSRSHIANLMRLLELPMAVQARMEQGVLSMGHGRALIGAEDCEVLAERVAAKGLSVRETERLVRDARRLEVKSMQPGRGERPAPMPDPDVAALERQLSDLLGLTIAIRHHPSGGGKGEVVIQYHSLDQLDLVAQRLTGGAF
jgi:ParB family transcriptional regulator, chromosome partitioning protein